jgi:deoxyadenosine/deoxycytidine kinase
MLITVEGNIGSGKTTLLKQLQNSKFLYEHVVVFENVGLWANVKDNQQNLFELYYTDKSRWSFVFQVFVLVSRLYDMINASKNTKIVICERCHLTDLKVFTELLYSNKNLTNIEYEVYKQMHTMVQDMLNVAIDAVVYIKAEPKVCLMRIKRRARDGEENISLEYLENLHNKHTLYIQDFNCNNVLELDGKVEDNSEERELQITKIIEFINSKC